jgi:hypothetical protein
MLRILEHRRVAEEQTVYHPEHRGVGPDAEGQGHDHTRGEYRVPSQRADRVAKILLNRLQYRESPRITALFLCQLDTAEGDMGSAARLLGGNAGGLVLLGLALDVNRISSSSSCSISPPERGAEPVLQVAQQLEIIAQRIARTVPPPRSGDANPRPRLNRCAARSG